MASSDIGHHHTQGCLQPAPALSSTRSAFPTSAKSWQEL